ncbi:MAG: hypothetical protein K1000chlam4_00201 [Chlamydiae bacterium]|nr:hypothetical protein [Chlamydiota bacterium]
MTHACSGLADRTHSCFQNTRAAVIVLPIILAIAIIGAVALTYPHSLVGHVVGSAAGIIMTTGGTAAFTSLLINLCCGCRRPIHVTEDRFAPSTPPPADTDPFFDELDSANSL